VMCNTGKTLGISTYLPTSLSIGFSCGKHQYQIEQSHVNITGGAAATVDRLQRDKGAVESALGEEGRKVEEEQRRSKAWRAQADKASLQVTCRVEGQAIGLLVGLVHLRPAPGRGIIGSVWWVSA